VDPYITTDNGSFTIIDPFRPSPPPDFIFGGQSYNPYTFIQGPAEKPDDF
jgi:hypothetical protein